jgi:hypothetical protein
MKPIDQKDAQAKLREAALGYVRASDDLVRLSQHIAGGGKVSEVRFRNARKKVSASAASLDMTALAYAVTRFPERNRNKRRVTKKKENARGQSPATEDSKSASRKRR